MLHNAVVLYRRTITFSYIVSTNHTSRLLRMASLPIRRRVQRVVDGVGGAERVLELGRLDPAPRVFRDLRTVLGDIVVASVKKSIAAMTPQCILKKSAQVVCFDRVGAGSSPCSLRTFATVVRATRCPTLRSSPSIRS